MERYNYKKTVREDVRAYIEEEFSREEIVEKLAEDRNDWQDRLYDAMMVEDGVTGNASGSYTFNAWEAEENICHNFDILAEAFEEFGSACDVIKDGAEACDVIIRCYLLAGVLDEVLDEMEEDYEEEIEEVQNREEEEEEEEDE